MATNKKPAPKASKSAKHALPAKKASVKTVANKKGTPVKKVAAKPVKKVAPVKKAAVVKNSTPAKPTAKKSVVKKAVAKAVAGKKAAKPIITIPNKKSVHKKDIKQAAPAKKATPAKKTVPAKKAEAQKKGIPAKKVITEKTPVKSAPKPAVKKVAVKAKEKPPVKAPAKPLAKPLAKAKAAAPKKEATPPPPSPPAVKSTPKKGGAKKKTLTLSQMPVKAGQPVPRPTPSPVIRPSDKKPNVIIAHRRLENKSKEKDEPLTLTNYQQESYRSILDEYKQEVQATVYRYSDEELTEFKELIANRLDAARKELHYLQGLITRKDEAGTEDTENRYMNMEDGSGAMEREQLAQLASRQIQFMGHLEKALVRIENKTYGVCRVTGKLIDKARLRAVPHATLSIEAKNLMAPRQQS